jgi:putative transposase
MTDLTYVRVKQQWHYLCIIVDVSNQEIVGRSAKKHENTQLVMDAISQIPTNFGIASFSSSTSSI